MKTALIGYGYWGRNVARTLDSVGSSPEYIIDTTPERAKAGQEDYGTDPDKTLDDVLKSDCEAVFIATPPQTHHRIAMECLEHGKHIFVEKPFTTDIRHAYEIIVKAQDRGLISFVDHVFLYSDPVKKLKNLLDEGKFGDVVYVNSRRINLGLFQHSVDVVWDLAVHDLSIIDYLFGLDIRNVTVTRRKYRDFPNDALANINFDIQDGPIINIAVSWLSPVKVREMIIGGEDMMAVYDDTAPDKLKVYDRGVIMEEDLDANALHKHLVQYRYGEERVIDIPVSQPLENAINSFIRCVETGEEPEHGKGSIINVMNALEVISRCGK
ncbi:Gfo/Idh/MocA family protein [Limisalsivibrio acetivorans]|uniref:Gfo/Idh/MocA family protein n=1 Tax=Limisalsivibrio acetivorans TaxID=1304888 RepID=UPI0003B37167|nr:Gfo/Idh/MocA family oxidoreductase [Limisalsivibrio acetivorans]